jgi:hypothetical protein
MLHLGFQYESSGKQKGCVFSSAGEPFYPNGPRDQLKTVIQKKQCTDMHNFSVI